MAEVPGTCGLLQTDDHQEIYWEEWGAPDGVAALYLHGGPGGTLGQSGYRHQFDLKKTRVIGFDQRGCGRSRPHAADLNTSLDENTIQSLISDIEALREARGVGSWIVNGVSWGSTLALAYAQAHPERVLGLVLFAVTTTGRREVDWITEGVGSIYPEAWDRFASFAEDARIGYRRDEGRLVKAYDQLLSSPDESLRDSASREWALWEDSHVALGYGGFSPNPRWEDKEYRLAFARLTAHYWSNDGFLAPPILEQAGKLHGIPGILIHGRMDVSGPADTAWELHQRWPNSQLIIVEGEGHGGPQMVEHWSKANAWLLSLHERR